MQWESSCDVSCLDRLYAPTMSRTVFCDSSDGFEFDPEKVTSAYGLPECKGKIFLFVLRMMIMSQLLAKNERLSKINLISVGVLM